MKSKRLKLLVYAATLATATGVVSYHGVEAKALESGATYKYTTDGSTPSATNGTEITGDTFEITPPDTDSASSVTAKVVGIKDGYADSDVATVTINFAAKDTGSTDPGNGGTTDPGTITAPTVTLTKTSTINRDGGIIALVSGRLYGYKYYYSLDRSDPTPETGIELTSSYVVLPAPDTDEASNVVFNLIAVKDSQKSSVQSGIVSYGSKAENQVHVSFRDRTYKEIGTADIEKGSSAESAGQALIDSGKLDVDGYTFTGWSESIASVDHNLIVRAEYEKDTVTPPSPAQSASYYIVNNGSAGLSHVIVGGSTEGYVVNVYDSATATDPVATGTVDAKGECDVQLTLPDDGGDVYVDIVPNTTSASTMSFSTSTDTMRMLSYSTTTRAKVTYPSRAVSQTYSLPILASRLKMIDATHLEVRGIMSGEKIKVYDKDNVVIGQATQTVDNQPMTITLSKDMSADSLYVSRTTPNFLESQQTELNKAIIQDQLSTTNQTVANAKLLITNSLATYNATNTTSQADIQAIVDAAIINSNITGTISGFQNNNATQDADGSVVGMIDLVNSSDSSTANIELNLPIQKLSELQTQAQVKTIIETALSNLNLSNSLTKADVLTAITAGVTDKSIVVTIPTFELQPATSSAPGSLSMHIVIAQKGHSDLTIDPVIAIPQLSGQAQTNAQAQTAVETELSKIQPSNSLTSEEIENNVKDVITDPDIVVTVPPITINPATVDSTGTITGTVTLTRTSTGDVINIPISWTIPKLADAGQTEAQAASAIDDYVHDQLVIKNDTTKDDVQTKIDDVVTNPAITADVSDFVIDTPATTTTTGSAAFVVTVTDTASGHKTVLDYVKEILKLIDDSTGGDNGGVGSENEVTIGDSDNDYLKELAGHVKDHLDDYTPTNDVTKSDMSSDLSEFLPEYVTTTPASVTVSGWHKVDATASGNGVLKFIATITDELGNSIKVMFDKFIDKLPASGGDNGGNTGGDNGGDSTSALENLLNIVNAYVNGLYPSNSLSEATVKSGLGNITPSSYTISLSDYKVNQATTSTSGSITFKVTVQDASGHKLDKLYTLTIAKISSGGSSHSGGGSSHSGGGSSSSGSNSSSNNGSTGTVGSGQSSEDGKAATGVVVGTDGTAGKPVTYPNSDGSSTEVTGVTKGGSYSGSVIHTGGSGSAGGSIQVGAQAGNIKHLYKYLPKLDKFVEVNNLIKTNESAIVMAYEANTTYYASIDPLAMTAVVTPGWNTANGQEYFVEVDHLKSGWVLNSNNKWNYLDPNYYNKVKSGWVSSNGRWYLLDGAGEMLEGWQQDSGIWYYLNPSQGDMVTGWKEIGQTWYRMEQNGAMVTGWKYVDGRWYYLNADGSMAANTSVDGYWLGADGAWIG